MSENDNPAQPLFTVWRRNEGDGEPIVVVATATGLPNHLESSPFGALNVREFCRRRLDARRSGGDS